MSASLLISEMTKSTAVQFTREMGRKEMNDRRSEREPRERKRGGLFFERERGGYFEREGERERKRGYFERERGEEYFERGWTERVERAWVGAGGGMVVVRENILDIWRISIKNS